MLVIVGYIVILVSVFGGFALAGGHIASLWQPVELLMIGGGAVGAFLVGNNSKAIKATLKALPTLFKGSKYNRALYMDMMALLYELLTKIRKEGLMSIEGRCRCAREQPLVLKISFDPGRPSHCRVSDRLSAADGERQHECL